MGKKLINTLAGLLLFGSGCSELPKQIPREIKENPVIKKPIISEKAHKPNLESVLKSTFKLKNIIEYQVSISFGKNEIILEEESVSGHGSVFAFARADKLVYFGTAAHCINNPVNESEEIYLGVFKIKTKIKRRQLELVDLSGNIETELASLVVFAKDFSTDSAILVGNVPRSVPTYNIFIESNSLNQGDEAYSAGFPHYVKDNEHSCWGKHLTKGIISATQKNGYPFSGTSRISSEASLETGMSGGPAFSLIDGVPVIFGVNSGFYPNLKHKSCISVGLLNLIKKEGLSGLVEIKK